MMTKLVRDRIPEIIRAAGGDPVVTVDRSLGPILANLREEVAELESAPDRASELDELADIFEVVLAAVRVLRGPGGLPEVVRHARTKRERRGGFAAGLILHDGSEPRRAAFYATAARDVARLRALLLAAGIDADPADVALAYHSLCETRSCAEWLHLEPATCNERFAAELARFLTEVPR